ncbi:MAG: PEP/pyruvate-binding domain-containing protein [Candidatus Omnitrophota bacterium]
MVGVSYSPDGKTIVTASWDATARVWDAKTGNPIATLTGHTEPILAASFSPDGKTIVTASLDGTAKVWDAQTGNPIATLTGHTKPILAVSFSPDGKTIVTASEDKTAKVWDAQTGNPIATLAGHTEAIVGVSYSPDGKVIVTASGDGTAKVWEAKSGESIIPPTGHAEIGWGAVLFLPGGKARVAASADKPTAAPLPVDHSSPNTRQEIGVDEEVRYVRYQHVEPTNLPETDQEFLNVMADIDKFEQRNVDVLMLLKKENMTVGDLFQMLNEFREMIKLYLMLFKGFHHTLEEAAANSTDLSGGRTIAQVFLRLEKAYKEAVEGKLTTDSVHGIAISQEVLEKLVGQGRASQLFAKAQQGKRPISLGDALGGAFDGQKTGQLIQWPAEGPHFMSAMEGISFAELINIVHQKGARNFDAVFSHIKGKAQEYQVNITDGSQERVVKINYYDSRTNPTTKPPLPIRYIAEAFAKGQLVHGQMDLFDPQSARIVVNETRATIVMRLGVHSARIQFTLRPGQEGGLVTVHYQDSGSAYDPGSTRRLQALAKAFQDIGFHVDLKGYNFEALYDKDHGASSIADLPEELIFAIQALTSTKDLDLKINACYLATAPEAVEELSRKLIGDGFLAVNGSLDQGIREGVLGRPFNELTRKALIERAAALGLDVSGMIPGQRMLDKINEYERLLRARMSSASLPLGSESGSASSPLGSESGSASSPLPLGSESAREKYERARRASPVEQILIRLNGMTEEQIAEAQKIALVARMVRSFSSRLVIGAVGEYVVERITLPIIGEEINFYVLKNSQSEDYVLAFAVLGEFFFDSPRYDPVRDKNLPRNELNLQDLDEILTAQNMARSAEFKEWLTTFGLSQAFEEQFKGNIFSLIRGSKEFMSRAVMPFHPESFFKRAQGTQNISSVSFGGVSVSRGVGLGVAALKAGEKGGEDFAGKILIARMTEQQDDPLFESSMGIIVTTGGPLSHAGVRSREHKKPAVILNGAKVTKEGLRFCVFKGGERRNELEFKGRMIRYYDLSDYATQEIVVRDGDLIYLDAEKGTLYVLAEAGDTGSIAAAERYQRWKDQVLRREQKTDLQQLADILKEVRNENVLKAIFADMIYHSLLAAEDMEKILGLLVDQSPQMKGGIVEFLRQQAIEAIEEFKTDFEGYKMLLGNQRLRDLDQVYILVVNLMKKADQLERLVRLANGNWESEFTIESLGEARQAIIALGKDWLKEQQARHKESMKGFPLRETTTLSMLNRLKVLTENLGLSFDEVCPELANKHRELMAERVAQVNALAGRSILWKGEIPDRHGRPLVGGKASHSAEIARALDILQMAGQFTQGGEVTTPLGFGIQAEEYRRHVQRGLEKGLDDEFRKALTLAYRDLVYQQAQNILALIEHDQRTNPEVAKQLREGVFDDLEQFAKLTDPELIDSFIKKDRILIRMILQGASQGEMSLSLRRRLEVYASVAVRSSGLKEDSEEESMAGMKESVLNVVGTKNLFEAILTVWKSGAEAILQEEMINNKLGVLAFSADPASGSTSHIRINAVDGLTLGLVNQVVEDPDSYLVGKGSTEQGKYPISYTHVGAREQMVVLDIENGNTKILGREKQSNPALSPEQIRQVAETVDLLSQFFGFHVDMEAGFDEDGRLVILQVRPITTLTESIRRGREILTGEASGQTPVGGIDFNPENLKLEVKGDLIEFPSVVPSYFENMQIDGLVPIIINIQPMTNLPLFLGETSEPERERELSKAY